MKRKKKKEEHVDEAWLLPYSDMLTLLLALFIVMFAMAKVDDEKFQEIRSEFGSILSSHHSGSPAIGSVIDMGAAGKTGSSATNASEAQAQEEATRIQLENQQLEKISEQLQKDLAASALDGQSEVSLEADGLHITLDSSILFASGSAAITSKTSESLDMLASALKKLKAHKIVIAGHTDNIPEKGTGRYESNWDLSAARAITVMNYFIDKKIISEKNAAIQAYADTQPKASNDTPEGRSENRRVEMIIQRSQITEE
ncbi:flagellar motor protein MotB [Enterococcus sp.]|jgi:chemotaxis protein MotB|uniref:OmpA/MotB family protein n=1 Tax=Enterococcus sp. TaxID=35783 RepID=UPI0025C0FC01|nr:flagellar motor protein MotB [Enterococcus sp.]